MIRNLFISSLVLVMLCSTASAVTTLWVHTSAGESVPFEISDIQYIDFDGLVAVKDMEKASHVLNNFRLHSNHPNPFNPSTNISYELAEAGNVEVIIYDVLGKEITRLVSERQAAGAYQAHWNGESAEGLKAAGGMYFYQLSVDGQTDVKKMLLIK